MKNIFIVRGIVFALILLAVGFFALNSYIYNQKQKGSIVNPYEGSLTGEYVCLPHRDTSGPVTLECAFGIKTETGEHYALDFGEEQTGAAQFQAGQTATLVGRITPIEALSTDYWSKYDIEGIFSVAPSAETPSDEEAELTGFQFILDFIEAGPPEPDVLSANAAYNALSQNAKTQVSRDNISRDLAAFVGVQDVPDQGASVEDLQVSDTEAVLTVGLNFSGGRVLRAVHLVPENGQWKVDSVTPVEER